MARYLLFAVLGIVVGSVSGLVGLGGGVFLIPALVMIGGLTQHQAVGTSLAAMVPPVTLAAAVEYYRQGYVDLKMAVLLAVTVSVGSWVTARSASLVSDIWLQRLFGLVLLVVAAKFLLKR